MEGVFYEIGVGLEFSYFSEVPWAVLDAANKASGENAWVDMS